MNVIKERFRLKHHHYHRCRRHNAISIDFIRCREQTIKSSSEMYLTHFMKRRQLTHAFLSIDDNVILSRSLSLSLTFLLTHTYLLAGSHTEIVCLPPKPQTKNVHNTPVLKTRLQVFRLVIIFFSVSLKPIYTN